MQRLPDHPGVYIFRDAEGKPIYIGKARSLRNRVRSHFHAGRSLDTRTVTMYNRVATIDYIETHSEMESLILESNLVKEQRPEYNIKLKDDKYFPYLRVDLQQPFPRVEVVRRHRRDGARYFGPYTRPGSLRETLRTLRRVFPYRVCTDYKLRTVKRPCLDYQIRRCVGPCAGGVTPEDYRAMMEELCLFLDGRRSSLAKRIQANMNEAAEGLRFERAAELRDQLRAVQDVMEKQAIVAPALEDEDAVGYAPRGAAAEARAAGQTAPAQLAEAPEPAGSAGAAASAAEASAQAVTPPPSTLAAVAVFKVREGKVVDRAGFFLEEAAGQPGADIIAAFIKQHYGQEASFIPSRILIPEALPEEDAAPIEEWLSSLKGRKVVLQRPARGPRRDIVDLASQNAAVLLREEEFRRQSGTEASYARAVALGETLGLPSVPERIEGYDISNIQGREAVGSMVVFLEGRPAPGAYRRFRIRTKSQPDDYAMMQEMLFRRFRRLRERGEDMEADTGIGAEQQVDPDAIRQDGTPGRGGLLYAGPTADPGSDQVDHLVSGGGMAAREGGPLKRPAAEMEPPAVAAESLDRLGPAPDLILIDGGKGHLAVAVEVLKDLDLELPLLALAKEQEEVFLPGHSDPLDIPMNSPALHLLRHVRDEAHRFAVGYHRLLRRKVAHHSELDEIPGIGPKRRTALLRAFGSTQRIREASVEDLSAVPEMGKVAAQKVWDYLHGEWKDRGEPS